MTEPEPGHGSLLRISLENLAILLVLARLGGHFAWLPWWIILSPLWLVPAAVVTAVLLALAGAAWMAVAWAADELGGAREKVARKRTNDDDWARWR